MGDNTIMINLSQCTQVGEVDSMERALYAVIPPILQGILYSLKRDMMDSFNLAYDEITLAQLARLYREGDGDYGICFEYAVHNAIVNNHFSVLDRIDTALSKFCKIKNGDPTSILFGAEKNGAIQLIDSVNEHLTDESALLTGDRGRSIKLKKHIQGVVNAFNKKADREKLPSSINGLWKADLFVGKSEPDKWVGTTVKVNPKQLEAAKGLRLAIVPSKSGKSDKIYKHETKNLIVCPLLYDQDFMEVFLEGWYIVKKFLNADARLPKERELPLCSDRFVCKDLESRRDYPVVDAIESCNVVKQPNLLEIKDKQVPLHTNKEETHIKQIVAPMGIE